MKTMMARLLMLAVLTAMLMAGSAGVERDGPQMNMGGRETQHEMPGR